MLDTQRMALAVACFGAGLFVAACGPRSNDWVAATDGDSDVDADSDVDGGSGADAGPERDSGSDGAPLDCGGTGFGVHVVPPQVVFVYDRSCSMRRIVAAGGPGTPIGFGPEDPTTRWYVAREAVRDLMEELGSSVHFGLMAFPRVLGGCGEPPILNVRPAGGSGAEVMRALESAELQPWTYCTNEARGFIGPQPGETPTEDALGALLADASIRDPDRETIAILVTDGRASCDATAERHAALGAALAAVGIRVAAVGFGVTDAAEAAAELEALGEAGGLAPAAGGAYYLAEDGAALHATLAAITAGVISCTLVLDGVPPDAEELYVFLDDVEIPRDGADGWRYDPDENAVVLSGASCDMLTSGAVSRASVVYGCPEPECTPSDELCDGLDNDCDDEVDEGCLG